MRVSVAVLLVTATGFCQTIVHPDQFADLLKQFEPQPGAVLPCEVTPIQPSLNFALHVRAGYTLHVPWDQSRSLQQSWRVLTTVTSHDGDGKPVYLQASYPAVCIHEDGQADGLRIHWV